MALRFLQNSKASGRFLNSFSTSSIVFDKRVKEELVEVSKKYFDLAELRPEQLRAMQVQLAGKSLFLHLPTGAGKSLSYQVPALMQNKVTIVVVPLLSLLVDQMNGLKQANVEHAYQLSSNVSHKEQNRVIEVIQNELEQPVVVFTTPETFLMQMELMKSLKGENRLNRVVLDEVHSLLDWGLTFRPSYLKMANTLAEQFTNVPLTLLTATASAENVYDICDELMLTEDHQKVARNVVIIKQMYDRKNLAIKVREKTDRVLENIVDMVGNQPTLIYAMTRNDTEKIAKSLENLGVKACAYHAGMGNEAKNTIFNLFKTGRLTVICATVALSMGVHVDNIRYVVHYNMPCSIRSYYQEIGRAGRDGKSATCVLFYSHQDYFRAKKVYAPGVRSNATTRRKVLDELNQVGAIVKTLKCRRELLFQFMGESFSAATCPKNCNCGVPLDLPPLEVRSYNQSSPAKPRGKPISRLKGSKMPSKNNNAFISNEDNASGDSIALDVEKLYNKLKYKVKKSTGVSRVSQRQILSRKILREILIAKPDTEQELAMMKSVGLEKAASFFKIIHKCY